MKVETHCVKVPTISQRFPNFVERNSNLSLVNISRPKPQTAYVKMKKTMIVWMIFGSDLLSSFSMSAIYSFLKDLYYRNIQTSSGSVVHSL